LEFPQFKQQQILVVGDVMLDRYIYGQVTRISPEAPVPVVHMRRTEDRLGGAANVALNIGALGGIPLLCSVVGNDADGQKLLEMLPQNGIAVHGTVVSNDRCTTVKTRVVGNHQQMLRLDSEDSFDLTAKESDALLARVADLLEKGGVGAVVLQDYNKGVLTAKTIPAIIALAQKKGVPVAVDPKKNNFFAYQHVALFKPNLKEVRDSLPFQIAPELDDLQRASEHLRAQLQHRWTMITLSDLGLFLDTSHEKGQIYPTFPRKIADVSGAGDTVIAVAALGLSAGLPAREIALLSNLAGGLVCEVPGVVPVDRERLWEEWEMLGK
jgi:D-glycero-beta-D-manno-heptose-7-phosphate kinase